MTLPLKGHLETFWHPEAFLIITAAGGDATGISSAEVREAAEHFIIYKMAAVMKQCPAQNDKWRRH